MPIYNKPPQSGIVGSNHNTADIDYHQSEAAKVKRTREQAYFNSYDFDAIEVLPYDDEDEADCNGAISQRNSHNTIGGTLKQLQQRKSSLSNKMISTIGNDPQHHHHHHQYDDFSTTSHISSSKSNNYTKQQQQQQQQYHYNNHINHYHHRHPIAQQPSAAHHSYASYLGRPVAAAGRRLATIYSKNNSHHHQHHIHTNQSSSSASSTLNDDNDDDDDAHTIVAKPDLLTIHDNRNHDHHHHQHLDIIKHFKLQSSSSEISSSSVSSAALELAAITKKSPSSSLSSSAQKVAASGCIIDRNSIVGNCPGTVAGAGANTTVSGDFSLPRAMLKYSSTTHSNLVNATTTLAAQATAAAAAATTTNAKVGTAVPSAAPAATATTGINSKSMPLATTTTTATAANSSTSTLTKQQQQKLNNTNTTNDKQAKTNGVMNTGFRPHKKFSTSSSISTIESEGIDIEIHTDAVDNGFEQRQQHQTTADVPSKQATTNPKPALSRSGSAAGATTTIVAGMRPRSASHQSHYSTDKSNSSGYYSSNVCSTYSLDEHIYCEPLNAMKTPNRKESVGSTSKQVLGQQQHPSTIITAAAATTGAATTAKREIDSKTMQHTGAGKHSISAATTTAANSVMNTLDFARRHFRLTDRTNDIIASTKSNNNVVSNAHIGRQAQVGAGGVVGNKEFSEHLRILESSIENLDRHLKTHPASSSHHQQHDELLVGYVQDQSTGNSEKLRALSSYTHLPTIREGLTSSLRNSNNKFWSNSLVGLNDDSLLDIDLDSFLLRKDEQQKQDLKITNNKQIRRERGGGAGVGEQQQQQLQTKGIDNPSFLTEEQEENHYKCAKYINSCPEDAYRVESDILAPARSSISDQSVVISVTEDEPVALLEPSLVGASAHLFPPKRYEDQMHFQNTRELLEDVRDKIRQLTQAHNPSLPRLPSSLQLPGMEQTEADYMPRQLQSMIDTLRQELEIYLARMNQHSEREIQQLCSGLVKNQTIVKMKNAFDRRRSLSESTTNEFSISYEALPTRFGGSVGCGLDNAGIVIQQQQITSIRCTSDPNFKMKRKSLTEVFPISDCYVENVSHSEQQSVLSQLHRNLNYQKPILDNIQNGGGVGGSSNELNSKNVKSKLSGSNSPAGADSTEANDQESILDRHRKKPSIWEMYYGTNRRQQSLLGCANTISNSNQNNNNNNSSSNHNNAKATKGSSTLGCGSSSASVMVSSSSSSAMCYPSSRPESDFTLDLPRAEQLRIKMEKEKKFRHRCRLITTFLSLIFFLLTVMVVSLVLTRGKRMFGSMI